MIWCRMISKLWLKSTWQAINQSNPQKPNNKQSFSETIIKNLQLNSQQHNNTSMLEKQNIDKLFKTVQVWNKILQKNHELISLLAENKALKKVSQMEHLSQFKAILIISHINQEINTFASVIKKINTFSTLKSE